MATKEIKSPEDSSRFSFVFTKVNYIIMFVGLALLALGYILLCGGGSDDPNVFNPAMFNARRLVVSPVLLILGFVSEIVAIMYSPKSK